MGTHCSLLLAGDQEDGGCSVLGWDWAALSSQGGRTCSQTGLGPKSCRGSCPESLGEYPMTASWVAPAHGWLLVPQHGSHIHCPLSHSWEPVLTPNTL